MSKLNEDRRGTQIRLALFNELWHLVQSSSVTFGTGVLLLLAGQAMANGSFTVGDFALFMYFMPFATEVPPWQLLGTFIGDLKQQDVSSERLKSLVPDEEPHVLLEHHPLYNEGGEPAMLALTKSEADRLRTLEVRGLSYRHSSGSAKGVHDISLDLVRGLFTVITGRIGRLVQPCCCPAWPAAA